MHADPSQAAAIPAVAQQSADHVVAIHHEAGHIVGLIQDALAIVGEIGRQNIALQPGCHSKIRGSCREQSRRVWRFAHSLIVRVFAAGRRPAAAVLPDLPAVCRSSPPTTWADCQCGGLFQIRLPLLIRWKAHRRAVRAVIFTNAASAAVVVLAPGIRSESGAAREQ